MSRKVTFRERIYEDQVERINLHTNDGLKGYKISKFQIMPVDTGGSGNTSNEATMQLYSVEANAIAQAALTNAVVDFSDPTLIGVAFFLRDQGTVAITSETIIFDNLKFNQDVFVVYKDSQTNNEGMNYHIELEEMKLDLNEQTVATLKNIRNTGSQ
jgi:hypothetical protein